MTAAVITRVALAAAVLGMLASSCASDDAALRPTLAEVPQTSLQPVPTTAQVLEAGPVPTPTALRLPFNPATPSEYVLYNETNGFRGNEPGNELVLASFDDQGEMAVWHTWANTLQAPEGSPAYLTDQGNLLIAGTTPDIEPVPNIPIGNWSTLRLLAGDGTVLWEHVDCGPSRCLHHDIEPLPNGNVLVFVYYRIAADQAAQYGLDAVDGIWMDEILELQPIFGPNAADSCDGAPWCTEIVWQWDTADHVVIPAADDERSRVSPQTIDLRASDGGVDGADPIHFNGIDYNPRLDQIAVSSFSMSEVYIIDHGGSDEILYRWGRPTNYGQDGPTAFGHQHDARWIDDSTLSVMNNNSPFGEFLFDVPSEVVTLTVPIDEQGTYQLTDGQYGPEAGSVVVDRAREPRLNAPFMSGATVRSDGSALVSLSLSKELVSFDSAGATNWLVRLPGPGGQFWKAQLLSPTDPAITALVGQVGELAPSQHRCHADPMRDDCQPAPPSDQVDSQSASLPGADLAAETVDASGVWQIAVDGQTGVIGQLLEIIQDGAQIAGFVNTFAISGSVQGNVLVFTSMLETPFGELPAEFELVVQDQTMSGTVEVTGLPIDLAPFDVTGSR